MQVATSASQSRMPGQRAEEDSSARAGVPYLRNAGDLTGHGDRALRAVAADLIEHALLAADPYRAIRALLHREGNRLTVGDDLVLDLERFEHIYILGAGKASRPIAEALEEVLGDRISDGLFVLKHGDRAGLRHARVLYGAHPVPDEQGLAGAASMMALAARVTPRDLVCAGISGGSSALLPLPVAGVSFADKQRVNRLLLHSGADITEINAVRKHLSRIKGGRLAQAILPATLINLTVSDVVGDPLDYITDPTVPDTSTFADACQVLDRYELWEAFPPAVCAHLRRGDPADETPKDFGVAPLHTFVAVDTASAALGAAARARALGYQPLVLTTMLKGEAKDSGAFLAAIANEIVRFGRPVPPPCAVIAAGENTVTISGQYGRGGPSQTFALAAALDIAGLEHVVIAALDTDGTDGPTELAGGMVDGATAATARRLGHDPFAAVRRFDSSPVLEDLGDAIITGPTGTNVNDLKLLLVGGRQTDA